MASLPIRWIVARAFCQATEEEERVRKALDVACPNAEEARDSLEGQFGNPLISITRRVGRSEDIRSVWHRWRAASLLGILGGDVEDRVDGDGILHFRIDKQAAFGGELTLARGADAIDIQVKLKAYPAKREEILRVARDILSEAG